jgi:hypothetical protein
MLCLSWMCVRPIGRAESFVSAELNLYTGTHAARRAVSVHGAARMRCTAADLYLFIICCRRPILSVWLRSSDQKSLSFCRKSSLHRASRTHVKQPACTCWREQFLSVGLLCCVRSIHGMAKLAAMLSFFFEQSHVGLHPLKISSLFFLRLNGQQSAGSFFFFWLKGFYFLMDSFNFCTELG